MSGIDIQPGDSIDIAPNGIPVWMLVMRVEPTDDGLRVSGSEIGGGRGLGPGPDITTVIRSADEYVLAPRRPTAA